MTNKEFDSTSKNENGSIPVSSVRQLVCSGHRRDPFLSDAWLKRIDEILTRIPRGSVSLCREKGAFKERSSVKIQNIKPELCGIEENSIRFLKGDPDKKREISRSDETALVEFLQEQGYNEEHLEDRDNEICARYFVRSIAIPQPTK